MKAQRISELERVLMERDGETLDEVREQLREARDEIRAGRDPEEILYDDFGLEPDYFFDLIEGL